MSQDEVSFGRFRLDLHRRTLTCEGAPVVLKNKAFDILAVLASARGKLVTKDELMAKVWPGLVVEESNIQVHVSVLRKALGEERDQPVHLFTVSGRGYRLVGATASTMNTSKPDAVAAPSFSDRPSIVVLPFTNMSGDPEQDYFADGVAEDIITGLSRIKWLFVIARNSSFIYKGKAVDVRQVGCDLGVRYALEGSVRKSGDRVRIAAQLIETQSALQVWAERYDRRLGDIFDVQDEIAMSVIGAIEPGLRRIELARIQRKRPDSLDAYDLVLQALPFVYKLMPAGSAPAIPLLQKALALEPDYSLAHATLAWCFHIRFGRGGLDAEDRRSAIHHAHAALSGAGDDATTLAISAFVIWFEEHDMAMAFDLFDRALSISSLNFVALCTSAVALAWSGKLELSRGPTSESALRPLVRCTLEHGRRRLKRLALPSEAIRTFSPPVTAATTLFSRWLFPVLCSGKSRRQSAAISSYGGLSAVFGAPAWTKLITTFAREHYEVALHSTLTSSTAGRSPQQRYD